MATIIDCLICGEEDARHAAFGLCSKCYQYMYKTCYYPASRKLGDGSHIFFNSWRPPEGLSKMYNLQKAKKKRSARLKEKKSSNTSCNLAGRDQTVFLQIKKTSRG